jgi:hypothetical protein
MIETKELHLGAFYADGIEMTETETGISLTGCVVEDPEWEGKIFHVDPIDFDVISEPDRIVGYGVYIVHNNTTKEMEYSVIRGVADDDGYYINFDYRPGYIVRFTILDFEVTPDGERNGIYTVYSKGQE